MQHRPENFNPADEDPEATLVAPRFDADDARRAHPVVPLAEATHANAPRTARRPRRSWTNALLAVALLAVAALGGAVATKVMQSPRAERVEEQTQAAPSQAMEAPPQPSTTAAAEAPREEASADRPAPRETRARRARAVAAPAVVEPALEDDNDDARGKAAGKRREREDEVEKEMRKQVDKALKHAKGKAPRLVDVLTNP